MMVALAAKPPLWVAAVLVGAFAIFLGYAHGAELPIGADAVAFSMGFVIPERCTSSAMRSGGFRIGEPARSPFGQRATA
jgi:urease accessory protein